MQWALAGEEKAREAKVAAETADQMKSRFLAIIAHEIRTPLNGLLGMLQVLDPNRLDRDCLNTAKEAGEMLRHLVENVLEYGRDGAAAQVGVLCDVDLPRLVAQIVDLVRNQAEAKGLTLAVSMQAGLPVRVRIDRARLSRILLNLLGNAIKFTDTGTIVVEAAWDDGSVAETWMSFRIRDTGIGIAPEMRDSIFGEFVQADDSITRRFGGVGLGLAISRRMAEQMGGTLVLRETSQQGSCFQLDLPVERTALVPLAVIDAPERRSSGRQVLVVDDDEINLRVARHLLEHLGHHPHLVKSGRDALAAVARTVFDVILMDVRMPDMDGLEATRQIRRQEDGTAERARIIAMTADLNDETLDQCLAAGMDGGFPKPVQLDVLRDHVMDMTDEDFLQQQVAVLGLSEMIRLARIYNRISGQMIVEMTGAVQTGDLPWVEALAHRLRSASGPLGLAQMAAKAARIENMARSGHESHLRGEIRQLDLDRRSGLKALARQVRKINHSPGGRLHGPNCQTKAIANPGDGNDHIA